MRVIAFLPTPLWKKCSARSIWEAIGMHDDLREIIASTNLIILLEDEIFADFFNTFLSLPVFGQVPFYTVENSQWSLWPEIPYDLLAKYKGLLTWLEKYRLPFFCKTNLCFQYILCQELISFINSPEGAKMIRWRKADQWLLQKCIGGVRGMWRFCSFLKGSAGEELVDFWILAEKILSIDEMDLEWQDHYLSLLLVLKATHLQEGSKVVTLCNTDIKALLNLSIWHPNQLTTRREILSHMQKVALFKLQSYWLPNFYIHAKMSMAKEESCKGLLQEYETRLCSICYTHLGGLPLNMSIRKSHHPQKWYSSRKSKRKLWQLIDCDSWSLEMEQPSIHSKPDTTTLSPQELCPQEKVIKQLLSLKVACTKERIFSTLEKNFLCAKRSSMKKKAKSHFHMEGLFEPKFSSHLRTPIISHSSQMTLKKAIKQSLSLGYTHWALCADIYAGNPFHNYMKKQNLQVETRLLDLWQDLHYFLSVLMRNRKNGNAIFRHILGNRICELYLNEQIGPCLPLKSQTIQGLKETLPSGDVNPWIPKAQKEICKMLSSWYDQFLDEEDYWFLLFTTQSGIINIKRHKKESLSKEESVLLFKRIQEALELSQALANLEEMESLQWQKVATEDLRQGGSLQVEPMSQVVLEDLSKMNFEELCCKNPKLAIEMISDDYKIYCEKVPEIDFSIEIVKEPTVAVQSQRRASFFKRTTSRKPSLRPRNLMEVLLSTQHLDFFRAFLRERKSECPLQFLMAIQKITVETNEKLYRSLVDNVIKTYFHGKIPPEEMLQCNVPFIKEISHMRRISTTALLTVQGCVIKSLEEKWFKDYQELFPPGPLETENEVPVSHRKVSRTTTYLQESQKRGWLKMISFIRSFCKYRRFMLDPNKRQEFEEYLHLEMYNNKDNFTGAPNAAGRPGPLPSNIRSGDHENEEITLLKRRILGHRIITVNYLVNDLYFFSEMEKFNNLVSSAHMLQINRAYNENDLLLMRAKIGVILRLFLQSDIPPRLRVNISESQKDAILAAIMEGHLDRSIFHGAIMSLFPIIIHFWKRFCSWKEKRSYLQSRGKKFKEKRSPPKPIYKYPPWSAGDHATLRFTLLRGVEWLRTQQREVIASPPQNSSSSNLSQLKHAPSLLQLSSLTGLKGPKREKK
ncbi:regulator of G-protein signaling protein-like isoform X5 [Choloepus didactylus]|uniref:regulator of G-protein signaling protein-like isoform X5 n=1 Tax=Choloepus didactylus TaxID=27675 RepID=UPI0018A05F4C|nr:regulator of G-protein signaling protein-like isoform X5 [Choloepus didactylus]